MRRTLLGIVALATAVAGGFVAAAGPAQAGDEVTTIVLEQTDVTLGEAQTAIEKATKQKSELPSLAAVASGSGKVLPTVKQVDALLSGKSIDDITLYRTTDKVSAGSGVGQIVEGTPLPAVVLYRTRVQDGGLHHEVIISCSDVCRIYVRDWIIR